MVPGGVRLVRGEDPQGNPDEDGPQDTRARQKQGGADALGNHHTHLLARAVGGPKIPLEQAAQPEEVAHDEGLVQAQGDLQRLQVAQGHLAGGGQDGQRTARRQIDERVNRECDTQEDRYRIEQPFAYILEQMGSLLFSYFRLPQPRKPGAARLGPSSVDSYYIIIFLCMSS